MQPLILVDLSVHTFNLASVAVNVPDSKLASWARANWIMRLSRPLQLDSYIDASPIIVMDHKVDSKYWRTLEFAEYKGQRQQKTEQFKVILKEVYKLTKVWSCPWMEADDLIAEAARIQRRGKLARHIYISSVDHDLLQVVSPDCTFVSTGPWAPRIKDEPAALAYVYKNHKVHLKSMQEFAKIKAVYGDKGDNLPKNCGLPLVDLIAPPCTYGQHSLTTWPEIEAYTKALQTQVGNPFRELAFKAASWCMRNGLPMASFI